MVVRRGIKRTRPSSFQSITDSSGKKKRVSFANGLEESRSIVFDGNSSSSSPGNNLTANELKPAKGILKRPPGESANFGRKRKIVLQKTENISIENDVESQANLEKSKKKNITNEENGFLHENIKVKKNPFHKNRASSAYTKRLPKRMLKNQVKETTQSTEAEGEGKRFLNSRKSRTLKVSRSTKEVLMNMNKKERREFVRQLAAKRKPHFELIQKAKHLWETTRSSKTPEKEKADCVQELLILFKGNMVKLIYIPSTCRIVQGLLAKKGFGAREIIFTELKSEILKMAKDKYAWHTVSRMLKYGSKEQRDSVITAFCGHIVELFKITYSARILDSIYSEYGTSEQRNAMICEFYGPEFVLFNEEMRMTNELANIFKNRPEKMTSILRNLENVLENTLKKMPMLQFSITHKLLLEYLIHCTKDQRESIIETLMDQLPHICHTYEGSRAAMICIWNANPKERKAIVKSFKGLAINSCQNNFSRLVLFAIFDTVDDTVLVNKFITKDIADNIADLIYHKSGVWVLHYLVHPRDHRVIGKGVCRTLTEGDSNPYSKKQASIRYLELFECIKPSLLAFMRANLREMIMDKISAVLILDTLEPHYQLDLFQRIIPDDDLQECFRVIAKIAADEFTPFSMEEPPHIVQRGCARYVFRKLLYSDKLRTEGNKLSDFLAEIPSNCLSSWTGMDCGCYTLIELHESGSSKAKEAVRTAVNLSSLKKSSLAGAKKLYNLLIESMDEKGKMMINSRGI